MNLQLIVLSVPTSGGGATAAATYSFLTSGYQTPRQGRSSSADVVHNQNGVTIHRYDNGPNLYTWQPFDLILTDDEAVSNMVPAVATQSANLRHLWNYKEGPLGMGAPDGVYSVAWVPGSALERRMSRFPTDAGDKIAYRVTISLEEA